jgi:hypothetical protein
MTTVDFCNCDKDYLRVANASSLLAGFSCVPCPLGQICFNGTNSSCPPFSYAPGKVASFMDCACLPGYYNATVQNSSSLCQICDPKFYCPGGGLDKVACPDALQLSPAPATNVSACYCQSGYYGVGTPSCTVCPASFYCALGNKYPCPQNMASPEGSWNTSSCTCNAGYWGPDAGGCRECYAGTYNTMQGCQTCSNKVASDCLSCEAGTYSTASGRGATHRLLEIVLLLQSMLFIWKTFFGKKIVDRVQRRTRN